MIIKLQYILTILMTAFLMLIAYIFLHESGHALVALLCGAHITTISIIDAYTSWQGGNFTAFTSSIANAGGVLLPILFASASLIFYRKSVKNAAYHFAYTFITVISIGSALVWVFFPVASLFTSIPGGEDATKFL